MRMCNTDIVRSDRGQTIVVFALVLPILILFAGLGIDVGILYVTKAKLSTSVDAACLTGMKTLQQGQTTAAALATNVFDANFGTNPPVPAVTFPTDAYGGQQVKVTATAEVNTFFMRILPQWRTVPVSDTAVATRGKLVMSIVLDRSGSMCGGTEACDSGVTGDDGGEALKAAVPLFVANFDDNNDEVAMVSFASDAGVDVAINYTFKSKIDTAVSALKFTGGTFGTGAGTQPIPSTTNGPPLSLAQLQNDSITPQPGQNVVKVIVYFTDGLMNTIQDSIYCKGTSGSGNTILNYGGYDSSQEADFFDYTKGTDWCPNKGHGSCESGSRNFPYDSMGDICKDKLHGNPVITFNPQQPGNCQDGSGPPPCPFNRTNVTSEATYRAIQTAIAERTDESPGPPMYIFTIGLGLNLTTQDLLKQLANDPSSSTYIKGQPKGQFFPIASCSGGGLANCKAQLNNAFQTIAAKVLLRLTQ